MNIEKDLQNDGIFVTEKIDTETILNITNNISKKIAENFPNFNLDADEIFSKLFILNMYKATMPDGMAEASYCYKNFSIYFNSHISDEDLEEFAIHECLHFLQEVRNDKNAVIRMGLSNYSKFKTIGTGLNEAAVQYISAKIIGIKPDFERYYDINVFTPSSSYYPIECALLNELIYFVGEDVLFKSTYFSTDDFKDAIITHTSKKTFQNIQTAFDNILKYEEKILSLNNKVLDSDKPEKFQNDIPELRDKIKNLFIKTQNLIIQEFFEAEYNKINNFEDLENCRNKLEDFKNIIGTVDDYTFFDDYCMMMINRLEHKSNVLENGCSETSITNKSSTIFNLINKIKDWFYFKKANG